MEADAFQRCAGQFRRAGIAGQSVNRAPAIGPPIGRTKPGKGGHQNDILARIGLCRQWQGFLGLADDFQPVAQPLHDSACHKDRTFQRICRLALQLIGDGGQQAVLAGDHLIAGVQQGKTARAIGGFQHAGGKASLPHGGRLLIARHAKDRDFAAKQISAGHAEVGGRIAHLRQHIHGHSHQRADIGVPLPRFDVVKHGPRGVGGVGGMDAAPG